MVQLFLMWCGRLNSKNSPSQPQGLRLLDPLLARAPLEEIPPGIQTGIKSCVYITAREPHNGTDLHLLLRSAALKDNAHGRTAPNVAIKAM
jgi:hypothetical protein